LLRIQASTRKPGVNKRIFLFYKWIYKSKAIGGRWLLEDDMETSEPEINMRSDSG